MLLWTIESFYGLDVTPRLTWDSCSTFSFCPTDLIPITFPGILLSLIPVGDFDPTWPFLCEWKHSPCFRQWTDEKTWRLRSIRLHQVISHALRSLLCFYQKSQAFPSSFHVCDVRQSHHTHNMGEVSAFEWSHRRGAMNVVPRQWLPLVCSVLGLLTPLPVGGQCTLWAEFC
jgi:hypothetical protein